MFTFQELGAVLRFVFVFWFNLQKKKSAYKKDRNNEDKKDIYVGVFVVVGLTLMLFIYSFVL